MTPDEKKMIAKQLRQIVNQSTEIMLEVVKPRCAEHLEDYCRDYPHCAGCNDAIWEAVEDGKD